MRDGLPVIALVVAGIAFFVALSGAISGGPSQPPEVPEEALKRADQRLAAVERDREAMRQEIAELRVKVARAIEAGPGGGPRVDKADLEDAAKLAVDVALRKRLGDAAAEAGAGTLARTPEEQFNAMTAEIQKTLKLEGAKAQAMKGALARMRAELNDAYRAESQKKISRTERDRRAAAARKVADAQLAKILSPAEFGELQKWRNGSRDGYVKRLFGR